MTTRARVPAGNGGGLSAPGGVGKAAPLSGGSPAGAASRRRAAVPATAKPVVARRYAPSGTAVAHSARVRLARPTAPRIVLPVKITVKGAPSGRVAARWRKRHPLSSDLPRKDHRHLSGWTEPSVDSVRTH
jgi:hypothetical protein